MVGARLLNDQVMSGSRGANIGPVVAMTVVQVGYAGMNIIVKVALESGMNPFILVAYRQIFATLAIAPFAYFLERRTRPSITKKILFQIFLCALFGATGNQITYIVGLNNSTPTIACALSNILPAVTFLLAIPFGLESVGIRTKAGQAKIIGTTVCIGGAMFLSFYHGPLIRFPQSKLQWSYADKMANLYLSTGSSNKGNFFLGPFLLLLSSVSWAVWFIIQAKMGADFDAPYTSTAILSFISSLQSVVAALCFDHRPSSWSLLPPIRLTASLYAGTIASALAFVLMSWSIQKKGPLFVSVFSPLLLVIVALLSWALLNEKIYVGTLVGSALIVLGLYVVLWGKTRELNDAMRHKRLIAEVGDDNEQVRDRERNNDLEMQSSGEV